jgi:site-specific DNA recombinase
MRTHCTTASSNTRVVQLVETGIMDANDSTIRDLLVGLKLQRDEHARDILDWQRRLLQGDPGITPEKVERLAVLLKDKLYSGEPELLQSYARLMMQEVRVAHDEIRISGSKSVLARCATEGIGKTSPAVLSFAQEWRALRDSNS